MTEGTTEPVAADEVLELLLDVRAHLQAQRDHGAVYPIAPLPTRAVPLTGEPGPVTPSPRAEPLPRRPATPIPRSATPGPQERRSLRSVRDELGDCQRCALAAARTQLVFGVGPLSADLLFVGAAPGPQDDQVGAPFVGEAGELLDRIIVNVLRLDRGQVALAHLVQCHPPQGRAPRPEEFAACAPFFWGQIEAFRPRVVVALGALAAQQLLCLPLSLSELRGAATEVRGMPVLCTHHPADLLRSPADKRETMADMLLVRSALERSTGIALPPVSRGR